MANPIQQLEEELNSVATETVALAGELKTAYLKYLQTLGDCIKKQLILSAYQICTKAYPKRFLELSVNDRQRIQTQLKDLTHEAYNQIIQILEQVPQLPPPEAVGRLPELMEKVLKELGVENFEDVFDQDEEDEDDSDNYDLDEDEDEEYLEEELSGIIDNPFESLTMEDNDQKIDPGQLNDPAIVVQWYEGIDHGINTILAKLSKDTNEILQDHQVLPNKVPDKLMEMVLNTSDGPSNNRRAPHILNVMVEASPKGGKRKDRKLIKIIAIRMKVSEIEFSIPLLGRQKNTIREILDQVKVLEKRQQQLKRKQTIAEADLAWRSIWFEE